MVSSADQTSSIVVSTMMEAWSVEKAGLFKDGTVKDVRLVTSFLELECLLLIARSNADPLWSPGRCKQDP